jgi:hypothetical protein
LKVLGRLSSCSRRGKFHSGAPRLHHGAFGGITQAVGITINKAKPKGMLGVLAKKGHGPRFDPGRIIPGLEQE